MGAKKFIRVWLLSLKMAAQDQLTTNWGGLLFIIGKVVRFLFFFAFIFAVLSSTKELVGFSREQVILFFLIFSLVDVTTQFLFRGLYRFRWRVVGGDFDLDLTKPLPSFFQPLFSWSDILDFITLIPLIAFIVYFVMKNQLIGSWMSVVFFFLLFLNAILIVFAFHLLVAGVGVMTTEVDHLIWIWRDFFNMVRLPADIYPQGLRLVITFLIPIIIVVTVPAKALMGILTWPWIILSFLISGLFLWGSLKFWRFALVRYSSASS